MRKKRSKTVITHRQTHTHSHRYICADKPRCEPVTRTEHPLTDTWQGFVWVNRHTPTHTHTHTYDYLFLCAHSNCIPGRRHFGCLCVCVCVFVCDYLCHVHSIGLHNLINCSATFWHFMKSQNVIINQINIRLITVVNTIHTVCHKKGKERINYGN